MTHQPALPSPIACAALAALLLAGCRGPVRMYDGPGRAESEVALVHCCPWRNWPKAGEWRGLIVLVDRESTSTIDYLALGLSQTFGSHAVELLPGEHEVGLELRCDDEEEYRTLRWLAEPGQRYKLDCRRSARQPPVEAFVTREDTGEELGVSWIAPPEFERFGLDPARWRSADWRVEDRWHWIRFERSDAAGDAAREELQLEWSERNRWSRAPTCAWAHGVDLRRRMELDYTDFEWKEESVGEATSVYTWSGMPAGGTERLYGLVVLWVRDGRTAVVRYNSTTPETLVREGEALRAWGTAEDWVIAWEEARP